MSIGDKIRSLREKNDLTQEQLAKLLGVSDRTVSTWELGTRDPRMGDFRVARNGECPNLGRLRVR